MERSTVQSCLAAPFYPIKSVFLRTPSKSRMGLNAERCRRMHLFCHVSDTQEHVSFSPRAIKIGTPRHRQWPYSLPVQAPARSGGYRAGLGIKCYVLRGCLRASDVHYTFGIATARHRPFFQTTASCLIRSSSLRKPVRRKTSAAPLVLVTETYSRRRDICSTCSNKRTLCRPGNAGHRYFCVRKVFTSPATGGNKAAKLKAIREALRTAKRVWLATDCDREGQLIGQEILEHYKYHR